MLLEECCRCGVKAIAWLEDCFGEKHLGFCDKHYLYAKSFIEEVDVFGNHKPIGRNGSAKKVVDIKREI